MNKNKWILLFTAMTCLLLPTTYGQNPSIGMTNKGTAFWCAFMENLELAFNDAPNFAFQIEAEKNVTGTISVVSTGFSVPFTVAGGNVTTVDLSQAIFYPQGSENITNLGILITADDSIRVQALHWRVYFSETSALLPLHLLGSHYLAQCYRYQSPDQSAFVVVATADDTPVTITPSAITLNARPAGLPFTVTLNRGQTYQVQSYQDLAGTEIQSPPEKPIAVFGGARVSQVECHAANSHLYDQCLPLDREGFWGNRFLAVPFSGQDNSVLRILASLDSTLLQLDCDTVALLQRGQTWTGILASARVVYADKPIAVSMMTRGVACSGAVQNGDPALLNLLPEALRGRKSVLKVPKRSSNGYIFAVNTLTIITDAGQAGQIRLDGVPLGNQPVFPIGQHWEYVRMPVKPESVYLLESDFADFQVYLHGLDYANAYIHSLSFDRLIIDTAIASVALIAPDSVCVDSVFSVFTQGAMLQWLDFQQDGSWKRVQPGAGLVIQEPGPGRFRAAILEPGECQPRLLSFQITAQTCLSPPDTCLLRFPNAFTPNGDDANDQFGPLPEDCSFEQYRFSIYNRWGQQVFSALTSSDFWDGRTPDGQDAPADMYVWTVYYRTNSGGTGDRLAGELILLR